MSKYVFATLLALGLFATVIAVAQGGGTKPTPQPSQLTQGGGTHPTPSNPFV